MMIRPDNDELETVISIALKTAPAYALRNAMNGRDRLDREIAVKTLSSRVVAALRPYELARELNARRDGQWRLPLFPG